MMARYIGLFLMLGMVACSSDTRGPGQQNSGMKNQSAVAPVAEIRPQTLEAHGNTRTDNYFWLREREDPEVIANIDGKKAFEAMGAGHNVVENARHPYMHRTDSLDYSIILQGEIWMLMDEEDVHLRAGDVIIQQGTNHAWANRGTEPCLIMFVLNDAK